MTEFRADNAVFDIAIIGGGAGGVLAAIHALRQATARQRIALIEPSANLAEGVAYATRHAEHLLNVPARGMSAFAGEPGDFLEHVLATDDSGASRDELSARFVERRRYADYLRRRLAEARHASKATLEVVHDHVEELDVPHDGAPMRLRLQNGTTLQARAAVIAIGNRPKPLPARGVGALPASKSLAAWDFDAIRRIDRDAGVCIVGSGLSMVDALLSLSANGYRGALHVLSRHALLPLAHATDPAVAEFDVSALHAQTLRQRLRSLREHSRIAVAAGLPWQAVLERLRPHGTALWQSLSKTEQRRFLRHALRHWDVHRHRIAPQVHRQIDAFRASGQLRLHRGRLRHVIAQGNCVRLGWQAHDSGLREFDVDVVVNATGVELRAQTLRSTLLDGLLGHGLARPGPHGIGIDTTAEGRVIDAEGHAHPRLFALGSLRIGSLWESIAIPELRVQAETIARVLRL
ncbi:MAG: FAD/NAD(P)-binding protein [Pseudoxanthomonas sp.]